MTIFTVPIVPNEKRWRYTVSCTPFRKRNNHPYDMQLSAFLWAITNFTVSCKLATDQTYRSQNSEDCISVNLVPQATAVRRALEKSKRIIGKTIREGTWPGMRGKRKCRLNPSFLYHPLPQPFTEAPFRLTTRHEHNKDGQNIGYE
jgi:hypothetical protein